MKFRSVVVVVVVVVVVLCWWFWTRRHPHFQHPPMYVIHLARATKRIKNIESQLSRLSTDVHVFPAVDGQNVDVSSVSSDYDVDFSFTHGSSGEIACYLSHLELLRYIQKHESSAESEYAIVFEDDFAVVPAFSQKLCRVLRTLEEDSVPFDVLYLGNLTKYQGAPVKSRIRVTKIQQDINQPCWGLHGYVVRIKSLSKIINSIHNMNEAIDGAFQTGANESRFDALVLSDVLVTQHGDDESTIRGIPYHLLQGDDASSKNPST